jgi:transcriptional regulator with XRE-family HTH domain
MKIKEKDDAVALRKQGLTYREILTRLPVSKSSLSYWLRNIELSRPQLARISYRNDKVKRKFRYCNDLKRKLSNERKENILNEASGEISKLSEKELKLIGIALYWAEGYKASAWKSVSFTNTDPEMIKLMMKWFRTICNVSENRFRVRIQCHGIRQIKEAEEYWRKITRIPAEQFIKPYIKISPTSKKKMGNLAPYGICSIRIADTALLARIRGWICGISMAL